MIEKVFTLEEAEKLIPQLESLIGDLMEHRKHAMALGEELAAFQDQVKQGNASEVRATDLVNKQTELEFLVKVINDGLDAIEETGAQPKDLDMGLVDFPSVIDGETVLLCWKYGEKSIGFYHGQQEGFAGRKPLARR